MGDNKIFLEYAGLKQGALHYCGEVTNISDLPIISEQSSLYKITSSGEYYFRKGDEWTKLSSELAIDTKDTAGNSATSSKLYLVGTTERGETTGDYAQTYTTSGENGVYTDNESLYASAFYETSDARKKTILGNIDLDKAYQLVEQCSTILYKLNDDNKIQVGMIAQEIETLFPELIVHDDNDYLHLDYSRLTVIILRILKDLIERIKKLEH